MRGGVDTAPPFCARHDHVDMRIIRLLGSVALWIGAILGVVAGGLWVGGTLGYVQPLIVISGSMQPGIMTGDLLIDHWLPTDQLEIGDVVSLPSELTGKRVTHRVIAISKVSNDDIASYDLAASEATLWQISMKGDANAAADMETYVVGDEVLTPWVRVPGAGTVVSKMMEPSVAMPILLALLALLGLSLLDEPPRKVVRRAINRVRQRDPRIDELDNDLAAVGVDVTRLREMDDLDLALYALGIDIPDTPDDELWDFELPFSDGIGLIRMPDSDPPTARSTPIDLLVSAELADVDRRTLARSG